MNTRWACVVVVVYQSLAISTGAAHQAPPPSGSPIADPACAFSRTLVAENLLEAAVEQYAALLEATPGLTCAQDGFIAASLKLTPDPTPTPMPTPGPFAAAQALDDRGFREEAEAAYLQAVTENPGVSPPAELNHLDDNWSNDGFGDGVIGFLNAVPGKVTTFSDWLPILGGIVLLIGATKVLKSKTTTSVDIVPFDSGSSGAEIGSALAGAVQSHYTRITDGHFASNTKLVADAAAEKSTGIPAELAKGPSRAALALYNWVKIWKSKTYVFKATMISDPARGAGIVVSLELKNRVRKSEIIWFKEFFGAKSTDTKEGRPTAQDFLALSETVAIWLYAKMADYEPAPNRLCTSSGQKTTGTPRYHVTWQKWDSFALFRNSLTTLAWDDVKTAITLLHLSLGKDPDFLPARMNLDSLQTQTAASDGDLGSAELADAYKRHLALLRSLWEQGGLEKSNDEVIRPKLIFNYLAAIDYAAGWDDPTFDPKTGEMLDELKALLSTAKASKDSSLQEMIVPLELLRDSLVVRRGSDEERVRTLADYEEKFSNSVESTAVFGQRAFYGYACLCAAAYHHVSGEKNKWAERALDHLRVAVRIEPKTRLLAHFDPSLKPLRVSNDYLSKFNEIVAPDKPDEEKKPVRTEHVIIFGDDSSERLLSLGADAPSKSKLAGLRSFLTHVAYALRNQSRLDAGR